MSRLSVVVQLMSELCDALGAKRARDPRTVLARPALPGPSVKRRVARKFSGSVLDPRRDRHDVLVPFSSGSYVCSCGSVTLSGPAILGVSNRSPIPPPVELK